MTEQNMKPDDIYFGCLGMVFIAVIVGLVAYVAEKLL